MRLNLRFLCVSPYLIEWKINLEYSMSCRLLRRCYWERRSNYSLAYKCMFCNLGSTYRTKDHNTSLSWLRIALAHQSDAWHKAQSHMCPNAGALCRRVVYFPIPNYKSHVQSNGQLFARAITHSMPMKRKCTQIPFVHDLQQFFMT